MESNTKEFAKQFATFITECPSAYHAAHRVGELLTGAGFRQQKETEPWEVSEGKYFVIRDGAIIAYRVPRGAKADTPYRIVGCHTDSPTLKLKPNPDKASADGFNQVGVELYGGLLFNSWLDRDLELAGRIIDTDGNCHLVRTGAIMRVPQLAVHLDRSVNHDGLKLQPQQHMHPIWGIRDDESILDVIAQRAGLADATDIAGYDIVAADTQEPAFLGSHQQFLAGGRMDNLVTVFCATQAFLNLEEADDAITVLACFDHEEIGSATRAGASGPILEDVLRRICYCLGGSEEHLLRAIAGSSCLSSDVGHSVHPNYPERHDPDTRPVTGYGPILKINANQRYTTDALGQAIWMRAVKHANIPSQEFVSNNDMPCGSTIGPLTAARLGILTVDIGIPILSMHSIRELCHIDDLVSLSKLCGAYWQLG